MAGLIYKELWHDKKTREWSSDEAWLWVLCISFTEDHLKDGILIEEADIQTILTLNRIPGATVDALVAHRGLDRVDGGYEVHNYRERGQLRRQRAKFGRLGGLSKAVANGLANPLAEGVANYGVGVVKRIFETWKGGLPGERRVSLTPGRIRAIQARLREGYSEADLLDAAQGWQNDSWPERSQQNDLTILFRNGEQVEKFRDLWRNPPVRQPQSQAAKNAVTLLHASRSAS